MGNTESTPSDLHDNYLAVLKSIETRLGKSATSESSRRRASGAGGWSRAARKQSEETRPPSGSRERASSRPCKSGSKLDKSASALSSKSFADGNQRCSSESLGSKKRGKELAHRRQDTLPHSDDEKKSSAKSTEGRRGHDAKRQTGSSASGVNESTAAGSDWEDSAVNDFAEENECVVPSPVHFKLETKDSGVKGRSPRLFPCESELPSITDLDDEETQAGGMDARESAPETPSAFAEGAEAQERARKNSVSKKEAKTRIASSRGDKHARHSGEQKAESLEREQASGSERGSPQKKPSRGLSCSEARRSSAKNSASLTNGRKKERQPQALCAEEVGLSSAAGTGVRKKGSKELTAEKGGSAAAAQFEGFSPYSPSYAFDAPTPPIKATTTGRTEARASCRGGGRGDGGSAGPEEDADSYIYGQERNHFPFLDEPALSLLVPFLFGKSLAACMAVCPHWFMRINRAMERMCADVTDGFAKMYANYLKLWGGAVKLQPLQTADDDGVRVDWVIFAKVLPRCAGNILDIGYTYSYIPERASSPGGLDYEDRALGRSRSRGGRGRRDSGRMWSSSGHEEGVILSPNGQPCPANSSSRSFTVSYAFATSPANSSRTLWIHRDMCRFHGDETGVAAMGSVARVCVGDFLEVAVSVFSGGGRVALDRVCWLPPVQERRRDSAPSRGIFSREACPLERGAPDWLPLDQFRVMTTERLKDADDFSPHLRHIHTEFFGMDVAVRKSTYRAVRQGSLGATACRCWGFPCEVLPQGVPIVCPLTRRGLQHDRFLSVQLREGDVVDYYLSQGGANV
ncbi:hypothetical protein BESB_072430 [Besnoitia besnoiti]|uniref:F-box domain-containing protein n=1 Tax=Besnoitia besnoiti TaxID=94643 RepID=A0A2A9MCQ2_BESBE|nr:uncharacterized protein BESB_072430 [Besnoitia besnoiti]PFH34091.1 hypothetical protein BESB_072430 [Besnoitia besnoiti]